MRRRDFSQRQILKVRADPFAQHRGIRIQRAGTHVLIRDIQRPIGFDQFGKPDGSRMPGPAASVVDWTQTGREFAFGLLLGGYRTRQGLRLPFPFANTWRPDSISNLKCDAAVSTTAFKNVPFLKRLPHKKAPFMEGQSFCFKHAAIIHRACLSPSVSRPLLQAVDPIAKRR